VRRTDPDIIPTEGIFAVAYHLTRHGTITTDKAAEIAGCTVNNVRIMPNNASRVAPIARTEPGRWEVTDERADLFACAADLLRTLRAELDATPPGLAVCRPFKRRDVAALERVLTELLGKRE